MLVTSLLHHNRAFHPLCQQLHGLNGLGIRDDDAHSMVVLL